jgi:hypothetical protein
MSESKLKVGDIVILQDLKIHPECNGLEATVIGPLEPRESWSGVEPMPIGYLYRVEINVDNFEPGLRVAEYQMRHRPVELGEWTLIETATNCNPTNATANIHPRGTRLPAPDLSDMDRFHEMAASGWLAKLCTRLGGYNVALFKSRSARPRSKWP